MTGDYGGQAAFDGQTLDGDAGGVQFFLVSSTPLQNPRTLALGSCEVGLKETVKVPLQLAAQGNEAGVSFSLVFDPSTLQFVSYDRQ